MAVVNSSLNALLNDIANKNNYTHAKTIVTPTSSGAANFSSKLYNVTIKSEGKDDLQLFAKVGVFGENMREEFDVSEIYEREARYYRDISNKYKILESKHNILEADRLRVPKYYGCSLKRCEEVLVLENLAAQNYSTHDRFKPVDWKYAAKAADELAKFHALWFAYEKEYPQECAKLYDEMTSNFVTDIKNSNMVLWEKNLCTTLEVVEPKNRERVERYISDNLSRDKYQAILKPFRKPVLSHGDYRSSNLMHKTIENGDIDLVIIDYQTLTIGSPVTDLLYFIFNGTDQAFRRKHYKDLLEHYYNQLRTRMSQLGINPDLAYSKDDFDSDLKCKMPYAMLVGVFTLKIVTVDESEAPALDDNLTMSSFVVKPNAIYSERFNGIINDFIEWGVL